MVSSRTTQRDLSGASERELHPSRTGAPRGVRQLPGSSGDRPLNRSSRGRRPAAGAATVRAPYARWVTLIWRSRSFWKSARVQNAGWFSCVTPSAAAPCVAGGAQVSRQRATTLPVAAPPRPRPAFGAANHQKALDPQKGEISQGAARVLDRQLGPPCRASTHFHFVDQPVVADLANSRCQLGFLAARDISRRSRRFGC